MDRTENRFFYLSISFPCSFSFSFLRLNVNTHKGIKTRYSSVELPIDHDNMRPSEGNCNSDLCAKAARKALAQAGLDVTDLELILVATCTPDYPVPSTASIVQEKLGIDECAAIDIRSACCGSTQAIVTALQYLQTGYYSCAVVIGSETGSVFGNLTNKRNSFSRGDTVNAAMIGDGAAACVLRAFPSVAFSRKQRQEQKAEDEAGERGIEIVYSKLNCIGKGKKPGMYIPGGGSLCPLNEKRVEEGLHYFKHDYRGVLAHGAELYLRALKDGLQGGGVAMGDVDLFIPHQANGKITEIARKMGLPTDRIYSNFERVGNTANASLLLCLDEVVQEDTLPEGAIIMMLAAESTKWLYGTLLLRYSSLKRHDNNEQEQKKVRLTKAKAGWVMKVFSIYFLPIFISLFLFLQRLFTSKRHSQ
ncbi:Beta-ketoacyl-[acyl-carrier-protein] synthase III, variant 2 [Balamuthia mandrillaris]